MVVVLVDLVIDLHPLQLTALLSELHVRMVPLLLDVSPIDVVEEGMVADALGALLRSFVEGTPQKVTQLFGKLRIDLWLLCLNLFEGFTNVLAFEEVLAVDHFVHHSADAVNIAHLVGVTSD